MLAPQPGSVGEPRKGLPALLAGPIIGDHAAVRPTYPTQHATTREKPPASQALTGAPGEVWRWGRDRAGSRTPTGREGGRGEEALGG
jgi:hypothetical protein